MARNISPAVVSQVEVGVIVSSSKLFVHVMQSVLHRRGYKSSRMVFQCQLHYGLVITSSIAIVALAIAKTDYTFVAESLQMWLFVAESRHVWAQRVVVSKRAVPPAVPFACLHSNKQPIAGSYRAAQCDRVSGVNKICVDVTRELFSASRDNPRSLLMKVWENPT